MIYFNTRFFFINKSALYDFIIPFYPSEKLPMLLNNIGSPSSYLLFLSLRFLFSNITIDGRRQKNTAIAAKKSPAPKKYFG